MVLYFPPKRRALSKLYGVTTTSFIVTAEILTDKEAKDFLNSTDFSLQANYTDRATAACRRSQCQLLRIEGVAWSAQRIPTAVILGFLDRSRYFSIQVKKKKVKLSP
jgi:hypothetical protein